MTGPRVHDGTTTAALVLGILSVALIFVPVVSSVLAVLAVIFGGNALGAVKAGFTVNVAAARWGLWLGIVNLAVWVPVIVWWQVR